jgi:regulatory protein
VRAHLTGHGVDAEVADAVVEELIEQGALDDERFARVFVQDKRALEQWGAERIKRGLVARGIDRELADAALAEPSADNDGGDDGDDERDRALALLHHRFPVPPRERRDRERALGVLLRKGYEYELALEALERHCSVHG